MADIASNAVTITGSKKNREEFLKLFAPFGGRFTFQAIIPMPESLNIPASSTMHWAMLYALVMAADESGRPPLDMLKLLDPENEWEMRSRNGRYARDCKEKLAKLWDDVKKWVEMYPDDGSVDLAGDLSEVNLISADESAETRAEFLKYGQTAIANLRQYGYTDWYGWCFKNWGCKWDAGYGYIGEKEEEIHCYFCTPWSPPEPVFEEMMRRFPELIFDIEVKYEDGKMQHFHGENGEMNVEWLNIVGREESDECEDDELEYDECEDDELKYDEVEYEEGTTQDFFIEFDEIDLKVPDESEWEDLYKWEYD